jgi:hypothetical protein
MAPARRQAQRLAAERLLADSQLRSPALLGLDVGIAIHEEMLCRSGRGDLRPCVDIVLDERGELLCLAMPAQPTGLQERAVASLVLSLQQVMRAAAPAKRKRAEA